MMILLLLPTFVSANEIGEFKRTINLSLNCDYCKEGIEKTATFQLFANDEIVEDVKSISEKLKGKKVHAICVTHKSIALFQSYIKQGVQ